MGYQGVEGLTPFDKAIMEIVEKNPGITAKEIGPKAITFKMIVKHSITHSGSREYFPFKDIFQKYKGESIWPALRKQRRVGYLISNGGKYYLSPMGELHLRLQNSHVIIRDNEKKSLEVIPL